MLAISAGNLTCRFMKDVNAMLLQVPYNGFSAVIFGLILAYQYFAHGVVPLATITDTKAFAILIFSGLCNFVAQVTNFYTYQMASPALVSLLCYSAIVYNFLSDLMIFGVIPNQL